MSSTEAEIRDFDPFSRDPQEQLTALRSQGKVLHSAAMNDARLVLTNAECRSVLVDDSTYSSAFALGGPLAMKNPASVLSELPAFLQGEGMSAVVDADMPEHAELRRTMRRAYEPGWIDSLAPSFRSIAERLVGELPTDGEVDLVPGYTGPYVRRVMCLVMGIPQDMVEKVTAWAGAMETLASPLEVFGEETKMEAARQLAAYDEWATEFVETRREQRDAIGIYTQGDGESARPVSREVAMYNLLVHFVAGTVTTGHAMASTFEQLLHRPGLWEACVADPDGYAPGAFEETLRYAAPHRGLARVSTAEATLDGETVPPGTMVVPMLQSANRDETYYEGADEFCPARDRARDHLAFGHGRHLCVGAELARREAAEGIAAFAGAFPEARLSNPEKAAPVQPSYFFHGPARLDVILS